MDGWFNNSRQKEEEEHMVSALYHVISGGDDDNQRIEHHQQQPPVWGVPPQAPLVFSSGESSSSTLPYTGSKRVSKKKKKKKVGKEYRGVRRRGNKWVAEIWDPHQGKVQWLSSFTTAEEAARAYDRKVIEYRGASGAFPYLNFPLKDYDHYPTHLGTSDYDHYPTHVGISDNVVQTTTTQIPVGPGLSPSTSAGTSESAPSNSSTGLLPTNNITNAAAEEDDPLLLLDDFDESWNWLIHSELNCLFP